jgi:hypothetical protein
MEQDSLRIAQLFSRSAVALSFGLVCLGNTWPLFAETLTEPGARPVSQQDETNESDRADRPTWKDVEELKARVKALESQGKPDPSVPNRPVGLSPNSADSQSTMSELTDTLDVVQEQVRELSKKLDDRVTVNLYATAAFESFQRADSRFHARNVELFIGGQITSRLRAFTEIEFERAAKTSASTGTATDRQGEVEVEQGWLEYTVAETFKPRFGVILVPFGRFNLLDHFDPVQDLVDRPLMARRVVPSTWGEAGMGFTGKLALPNAVLSDLSVDYQIFAINGLTNAFSDTGTRNARGAFGSDNNANKAVVGRVAFKLYQGGELGFSGYHGAVDKLGHDLTGFDIDGKFRWGPVELIAEYAYFGADRGALQFGSTTNTVPRTLQGGYVQTNYYFWPEFLNGTFLGKHFSDPKFTAVFRYDFARIADDEDAGTVANKEERYAMGMNYRPIKNFVFKVEYQFNKTHSETLERGTANGLLTSVTAAF